MTPQCQKIYDILSDEQWHSNIELHESTGIYRYGARIFELKGNGYDIEARNGKKPYYFYRLKLEPKQLTLV